MQLTSLLVRDVVGAVAAAPPQLRTRSTLAKSVKILRWPRAQVHSMTAKLAQFTDVRVALVVGGLSLQVQAATLRTQPEVVVATPVRGRSLCIRV